MDVSITIIFKKENVHLFECLHHCLKLDYKNYEVFLLPDGKANKKLSEYVKNCNLVRIIPTGILNIPAKRNIGVRNSSSKFIAFIDSDAFPRKDWLKNALPLFKDKKIGAVGGPNLTPSNDSISRRIAGNVMKSKSGFGNGYIWFNVLPRRFLDKLPACNLIVRKYLFNQLKFDEGLGTGDDEKLCLDIIEKGFKVLYSPNVVVFHHRRKIFLPFMKQFFYYGLFKSKLFRLYDWPILCTMPALFLLFVVSGLIASFIHISLAILYASIMGMYFLVIFFDAIKNSKGFEIPLTWISIFLGHISYGAGFIFGYFKEKFR